MRLERSDIESLLPHRHPILMPNHIDIETPGAAGTGHVTLAEDRIIWNDWTGRDLADELVLESAAQIMGVVLATGADRPESREDARHLLLGFEQVEFNAPADPERDIRIEVRIEARFGGLCRGGFRALQGDAVVAAGRLTVTGA
jgi:3-hydroxymyristoyl/3-hydroxydecanoyl-(acyl carrier protein) dehydratase